VVHASTKYLGGHGDVLGGVVVARESNSTTETIRQTQLLEGSVPSSFDCWLVHRGFQTLTCRMRGHAQNALLVATAGKRTTHRRGLLPRFGFTSAVRTGPATTAGRLRWNRLGPSPGRSVRSECRLHERKGVHSCYQLRNDRKPDPATDIQPDSWAGDERSGRPAAPIHRTGASGRSGRRPGRGA